jgi:hypothetical protein
LKTGGGGGNRDHLAEQGAASVDGLIKNKTHSVFESGSKAERKREKDG